MLKTCHEDPTKVLALDKCRLWAGSVDAIENHLHWSLVISAVRVQIECPVEADERAAAMLPPELTMDGWEEPPTLQISWADYQTPALPRWWWEALVKTLRGIKGDVAICCQGGHGRTGTAISIIATIAKAVPKKQDPVLWVRQVYCEQAVESLAQLTYFEAMTGRKTSALPPPKKYTGAQSSFSSAGSPPPAKKGGPPYLKSDSTAGGTARSTGGAVSFPKTEPEGEKVTLWRNADTYGDYYTDEDGVLVAIAWEDVEDEDPVKDVDFVEEPDEDETDPIPVDRQIANATR